MDTFAQYARKLDSLIDHYDYWKLYFAHPVSFDSDYNFEDIIITCGATRCALIDDNCDMIVKFDIYSDNGDEICARELQYYEDAQKFGVDKCFVPVKFLGYYEKEIWFYQDYEVEDLVYCYADEETEFAEKLQEIVERKHLNVEKIQICLPLYGYTRVNCNLNLWRYSTSKNSEDVARSIHSPLIERNEKIAFRFIDDYGAQIYIKLSNFLNEWHINDLHGGNVGLIGDRIVLIDYAGYHTGDTCYEDYDGYSNSDREHNSVY